jgi:DNA-binding transcriptional regulator YiaG
MKTKSQKTSRILDAVHETARDLHAAGFVSKRRMKDYEALCLVPVPEYSSEKLFLKGWELRGCLESSVATFIPARA